MDIDLELNHYSQTELESLFQLPLGYDMYDIEQKGQDLLTKLTQFSLNSTSKTNIESFLKQARDKLNSFLIPKKNDPFIYSNPSDYFKGTINPLEKRLLTKLICIDSIFRPQYETTSSTDYIYTFPEHQNNVVSMKIASIEMPNMWYMFSTAKQNNSFTIVQNNIHTVNTIPDGNYLSDTFNTVIVLSGLVNGTVNVSSITSKTTFQSTSPFSINFTGPIYNNCGWMLGFKETTYVSTKITTSVYQIKSESSFGSTIPNYLFVEIDDYHNNFITDSVVSVTRASGTPTYLGKNIMGKIPVPTPFNTIMTNNTSDLLFKKRDYFGPVRLERLKIRIVDRFGNTVDLNQNDYSITIELIELYG
jgi:hypothetical protein